VPRWIPLGLIRPSRLAILAVVLALIAGAARIGTEGSPAITLSRTVATTVTIPGPAPKLAWPARGEAAVAVSGLGTLGSMRGSTRAPIASMAKMMTAYLTLLEYPLSIGQIGFIYTVTRRDVANLRSRVALDQSTLAVAAGEHLSEYQLLEGLLVPSGNNVAVILAYLDAGGNLGAFVASMNAEARTLGLAHTTYTGPSGYGPTTVSTALDQLRLAEVVMTNPVLAQIVDKASVTLPVAGTVENNDSLVGVDGFAGIKTGSDSQAEGCFAFADHRVVAGRAITIYGVVMGQGKAAEGSVLPVALRAAEILANSVAANLGVEVVIPAGTEVLMATAADGNQVSAVTTKALTALGWGGLAERVTLWLLEAGNDLRAGQVLGRAAIPGPSAADPVPAAPYAVEATATASMPGPGVDWRLGHLFQ
jgi:D-alanyl-D-alanine carboxypeptidase (penicillin-binding protein 5/6)